MNPFATLSSRLRGLAKTAVSGDIALPATAIGQPPDTRSSWRGARRYRFLAYCIEPEARILRFAGSPIAMPPKVFDVIVYLLERRHRAVGKEELMAAIWGRVDVAHLALAQAMLIARCSLNDTGREQSIIRTVLRFGYQWIAPVEIEYVSTPSAVVDEHVHAIADNLVISHATRSRRFALMCLFVLLAMLFALAVLFSDSGWAIA